jgi:hypothetical protein
MRHPVRKAHRHKWPAGGNADPSDGGFADVLFCPPGKEAARRRQRAEGCRAFCGSFA